MTPIPFYKPFLTGHESLYINQLLIPNNNPPDFIALCQNFLVNHTKAQKVLLTPSCTAALELACLLLDLSVGDEVIMPSYTFPSTATSVVLRGATPVFVDICLTTLNIDPNLIEAAITPNTKAIIVVHYAGLACDMDTIMAIAHAHKLIVIEDAAHALGAYYKGRALGSIGHFGTYSFHSTKNIQCGEGGALVINDAQFVQRAEVIQEKGTNRYQFLRGDVSYYQWIDIGSSYVISQLNAAFLWAQLLAMKDITQKRLTTWQTYYQQLKPLDIQLATTNNHQHNAHIFYFLSHSASHQKLLLSQLFNAGIQASSHYQPLHNSIAGQRYGKNNNGLKNTLKVSECLIRLPMWIGVDAERVCEELQKILT
jgi:dTDP-4-amino-4,6-dideoxygalactose transaminase